MENNIFCKKVRFIFQKSLIPSLYAGLSLIVLLLSIFLISIIEDTWGLHTLFRVGDIDMVVSILIIGGIIFGLATRTLVAYERGVKSVFTKHIHQSFILYLAVGILGYKYMASAAYTSTGLGTAVYTLAIGVFIVGILSNIAVLSYSDETKKHSRTL